MNIGVIGTGYVGLVTGACFAEFGVQVVCADIDAEKIARLERGEIPIYEPGLEELVERNMKQGRLAFTTQTSEAVESSLVLFIAVATPSLPDGRTDLRAVESVAREIGRTMTDYKVIVNKSTVPVGTSVRVRGWIEDELRAGRSHGRVQRRVEPGVPARGRRDRRLHAPDRVVIGTDDSQATAILKSLYRRST
jgi:UDPglucose 6-dehydrogenase